MKSKQILKFLPFYILSNVPLFILYIFSFFAFIFVYVIFGYRTKVVRQNLYNAFPDKTETSIQKIERKFYRHFCDMFIESLKPLGLRWKINNLNSNIHYTNPEILVDLYRQNKNVILYAAHFGNWEWLNGLPGISPYQVVTLYRKLSNAYFNTYMLHVRSKFGIKCFEMKTAYKKILNLDNQNIRTLNLMLGDQSPDPHSAMYWRQFLNQDTAFLKGVEIIGRKMNAAVIYPSFYNSKRGKYEVTFKVIEENAKASAENFIVDKYAELLEQDIKDSPELWLWTHRRWKRRNKKETIKNIN